MLYIDSWQMLVYSNNYIDPTHPFPCLYLYYGGTMERVSEGICMAVLPFTCACAVVGFGYMCYEFTCNIYRGIVHMIEYFASSNDSSIKTIMKSMNEEGMSEEMSFRSAVVENHSIYDSNRWFMAPELKKAISENNSILGDYHSESS